MFPRLLISKVYFSAFFYCVREAIRSGKVFKGYNLRLFNLVYTVKKASILANWVDNYEYSYEYSSRNAKLSKWWSPVRGYFSSSSLRNNSSSRRINSSGFGYKSCLWPAFTVYMQNPSRLILNNLHSLSEVRTGSVLARGGGFNSFPQGKKNNGSGNSFGFSFVNSSSFSTWSSSRVFNNKPYYNVGRFNKPKFGSVIDHSGMFAQIKNVPRSEVGSILAESRPIKSGWYSSDEYIEPSSPWAEMPYYDSVSEDVDVYDSQFDTSDSPVIFEGEVVENPIDKVSANKPIKDHVWLCRAALPIYDVIGDGVYKYVLLKSALDYFPCPTLLFINSTLVNACSSSSNFFYRIVEDLNNLDLSKGYSGLNSMFTFDDFWGISCSLNTMKTALENSDPFIRFEFEVKSEPIYELIFEFAEKASNGLWSGRPFKSLYYFTDYSQLENPSDYCLAFNVLPKFLLSEKFYNYCSVSFYSYNLLDFSSYSVSLYGEVSVFKAKSPAFFCFLDSGFLSNSLRWEMLYETSMSAMKSFALIHKKSLFDNNSPFSINSCFLFMYAITTSVYYDSLFSIFGSFMSISLLSQTLTRFNLLPSSIFNSMLFFNTFCSLLYVSDYYSVFSYVVLKGVYSYDCYESSLLNSFMLYGDFAVSSGFLNTFNHYSGVLKNNGSGYSLVFNFVSFINIFFFGSSFSGSLSIFFKVIINSDKTFYPCFCAYYNKFSYPLVVSGVVLVNFLLFSIYLLCYNSLFNFCFMIFNLYMLIKFYFFAVCLELKSVVRYEINLSSVLNGSGIQSPFSLLSYFKTYYNLSSSGNFGFLFKFPLFYSYSFDWLVNSSSFWNYYSIVFSLNSYFVYNHLLLTTYFFSKGFYINRAMPNGLDSLSVVNGFFRNSSSNPILSYFPFVSKSSFVNKTPGGLDYLWHSYSFYFIFGSSFIDTSNFLFQFFNNKGNRFSFTCAFFLSASSNNFFTLSSYGQVPGFLSLRSSSLWNTFFYSHSYATLFSFLYDYYNYSHILGYNPFLYYYSYKSGQIVFEFSSLGSTGFSGLNYLFFSFGNYKSSKCCVHSFNFLSNFVGVFFFNIISFSFFNFNLLYLYSLFKLLVFINCGGLFIEPTFFTIGGSSYSSKLLCAEGFTVFYNVLNGVYPSAPLSVASLEGLPITFGFYKFYISLFILVSSLNLSAPYYLNIYSIFINIFNLLSGLRTGGVISSPSFNFMGFREDLSLNMLSLPSFLELFVFLFSFSNKDLHSSVPVLVSRLFLEVVSSFNSCFLNSSILYRSHASYLTVSFGITRQIGSSCSISLFFWRYFLSSRSNNNLFYFFSNFNLNSFSSLVNNRNILTNNPFFFGSKSPLVLEEKRNFKRFFFSYSRVFGVNTLAFNHFSNSRYNYSGYFCKSFPSIKNSSYCALFHDYFLSSGLFRCGGISNLLPKFFNYVPYNYNFFFSSKLFNAQGVFWSYFKCSRAPHIGIVRGMSYNTWDLYFSSCFFSKWLSVCRNSVYSWFLKGLKLTNSINSGILLSTNSFNFLCYIKMLNMSFLNPKGCYYQYPFCVLPYHYFVTTVICDVGVYSNYIQLRSLVDNDFSFYSNFIFSFDKDYSFFENFDIIFSGELPINDSEGLLNKALERNEFYGSLLFMKLAKVYKESSNMDRVNLRINAFLYSFKSRSHSTRLRGASYLYFINNFKCLMSSVTQKSFLVSEAISQLNALEEFSRSFFNCLGDYNTSGALRLNSPLIKEFMFSTATSKGAVLFVSVFVGIFSNSTSIVGRGLSKILFNMTATLISVARKNERSLFNKRSSVLNSLSLFDNKLTLSASQFTYYSFGSYSLIHNNLPVKVNDSGNTMVFSDLLFSQYLPVGGFYNLTYTAVNSFSMNIFSVFNSLFNFFNHSSMTSHFYSNSVFLGSLGHYSWSIQLFYYSYSCSASLLSRFNKFVKILKVIGTHKDFSVFNLRIVSSLLLYKNFLIFFSLIIEWKKNNGSGSYEILNNHFSLFYEYSNFSDYFNKFSLNSGPLSYTSFNSIVKVGRFFSAASVSNLTLFSWFIGVIFKNSLSLSNYNFFAKPFNFSFNFLNAVSLLTYLGAFKLAKFQVFSNWRFGGECSLFSFSRHNKPVLNDWLSLSVFNPLLAFSLSKKIFLTSSSFYSFINYPSLYISTVLSNSRLFSYRISSFYYRRNISSSMTFMMTHSCFKEGLLSSNVAYCSNISFPLKYGNNKLPFLI